MSRALGHRISKEMRTGVIAVPYVSPVYELGADDTLLVVASDGVCLLHQTHIPFALITSVNELLDSTAVGRDERTGGI